MPTSTVGLLPRYRLHKASGQAVVTLAGRDVYLGRFESPEGRNAKDRVFGEWLPSGQRALDTA